MKRIRVFGVICVACMVAFTSCLKELDRNNPVDIHYNGGEKSSRPNLILYNLSVSPQTVTGYDNVTVYCTIENEGPKSAGSSNVRYYYSEDSDYSTDDIDLGEWYVSALDSGYNQQISNAVTLPYSINYNTSFIIVKIDCNNQINESDEADNYKAISVKKYYSGYGSVDLYVTRPMETGHSQYYLYIDNSFAFTFDSWFTYVMQRECGFRWDYNYVCDYYNYSGSYSYQIKYTDGTIIKSGYFNVNQNDCSAIDLCSPDKNAISLEGDKGNYQEMCIEVKSNR